MGSLWVVWMVCGWFRVLQLTITKQWQRIQQERFLSFFTKSALLMKPSAMSKIFAFTCKSAY